MKIDVVLNNGLAGCRVSDQLDIEDGATDDEIEAEVREWALERVEWSWTRAD